MYEGQQIGRNPNDFALGRAVGGGSLADAVAAQTKVPAVHAAQDGLDKVVTALLNEVQALYGALQPVLSPVPEGLAKENVPQPAPSVAGRIQMSADAVSKATRDLRQMRDRLEV